MAHDRHPSVWDDAPPEPESPACPQPGIYPGVSFEEYCSWDAINHSKLCRIDKSPLHCKVLPSFDKSAAIRLGQLVHCGRLEPDSLEKRYIVMPAFEVMPENVTKTGAPSTSTATEFVKDCRSRFAKQAIANKLTIVSEAEYAAYQSAMAAILENQQVVDLINSGSTELSVVWHDSRTGLRCKARIDSQSPTCLMDLKTSRDDNNKPLPESFEYSLWTYSYYSQAAWYQEGWRVLTGERLPFWFAVVGTTPPMQCIAAPIGELTLEFGRMKNIERLSLYAACKERDEWPGYVSPAVFELPEHYLPSDVNL